MRTLAGLATDTVRKTMSSIPFAANPSVPLDRQDVGKLVLRLTVGLLVLLHGLAKLIGGPAFIVGMVEKAGLPGALGYLVYVGEVIAPVLVLAGVWTRAAAAVIVVNMVVAVLLVHTQDLFVIGRTGGWALELQGLFLFGAVALALMGAGRYSVGGTNGRWN